MRFDSLPGKPRKPAKTLPDTFFGLAVVYRSAKVLTVWLNLGVDSCGRWLGYGVREDYNINYPGAAGLFPVSVAIADVGGAVADRRNALAGHLGFSV